ncbi:Protein still life, isoform SIF type 1 [Eumeta japonica]|uniref:Protein still life, isoform SIF type 1 n=1 Tax=Eumeta variegata TaxID=151549 RepID=A0A4C1TJE7_EUMVA|nr:Protein still life, isoform SIF type 1 [Eumeta japonica]
MRQLGRAGGRYHSGRRARLIYIGAGPILAGGTATTPIRGASRRGPDKPFTPIDLGRARINIIPGPSSRTLTPPVILRGGRNDHKLKHMADLQQSVVSDPETRAQLAIQMLQWEENLERLHCEQFRLRCYMASLQSGELPNPKIAAGEPFPHNYWRAEFEIAIKGEEMSPCNRLRSSRGPLRSLLTHVSRATKATLNKLGVFTVSSFHAFICARSPSLLNNLLAGRGATKRRAPNLSRSNSASSRRSMQFWKFKRSPWAMFWTSKLKGLLKNSKRSP